jgi:hypothetical protein
MTCQVRQTPTGWLAVSAPYAPIQIGVAAASESAARIAFSAAADAWARLRDLPDPLEIASE